MELRSSSDYVCDACSREVAKGEAMFLGRAGGKPVHACSRECFDAVVERESASHVEVPDFVEKAKARAAAASEE